MEKLACHYDPKMGRPSKELFSLLGLLILQQMFDLTDEEAVRQFAFNIEWHYALDITSESDNDKYVCPKTLWTMRKIVTEQNLYTTLFEGITGKLAKVLSVDPSHQRLDSMHIFSNMRHLSRIQLFVTVLKKFLVNLKRHHKALFSSLDAELTDRYCTKTGQAAFGLIKPSESRKTLAQLGKDLFFLVERFRNHANICTMTSYQLLTRLLTEQCIIQEDPDADQGHVRIKPNKKVPSDSLQNPSDPDASYDGHKGQGYQIQMMETYQPGAPEPRDDAEGDTRKEKKPPSLITHIAVEPAHLNDVHALLPAIASAEERGLAPKKLLVDSLYGSDTNCEKAKDSGVTVIAPLQKIPEEKGRYYLSDFSFSKNNKVFACPQGHFPLTTRKRKLRYSAVFHQDDCTDCPRRNYCLVKRGKKGFYLRYDEKAVRLVKRRAYQNTDAFREKYRYRAGSEATMSAYDRRTKVKHLRVRGLPAVSFCAFLKAAGFNILRAAASWNRTPGPKRAIASASALTQRSLRFFKEQLLILHALAQARTEGPIALSQIAIKWAA